MYPHRINLREPWQAIPQGHSTTYRRVFRWPAELMPFEQLWLVVGYADTPIQVTLNQKHLASQKEPRVPLEMDISGLVQNQNLLEISCLHEEAGKTAGRIQSVFLEVRRSVHLDNIVGNCQWNAGKPYFELTASIRGQVERKLSVVVRLNDKALCYQELAEQMPVPIHVNDLDVPQWMPRQSNTLQALEVQLLDPACVLSQHHYLTGFVDRGMPDSMTVEPFPSDEPILESAWLEAADRQGRLVRVEEISQLAGWRYLWHHPCIQAVG